MKDEGEALRNMICTKREDILRFQRTLLEKVRVNLLVSYSDLHNQLLKLYQRSKRKG